VRNVTRPFEPFSLNSDQFTKTGSGQTQETLRSTDLRYKAFTAGEPAGQPLAAWPHVSCDFGNFDIAGHPKPHAYWYAANWLQGFDEAEPGRPALPFKTVARILELPGAAATPPDATATAVAKPPSVEAVTTAPEAELFLDGALSNKIRLSCSESFVAQR
jgi:hypothetical protein